MKDRPVRYWVQVAILLLTTWLIEWAFQRLPLTRVMDTAFWELSPLLFLGLWAPVAYASCFVAAMREKTWIEAARAFCGRIAHALAIGIPATVLCGAFSYLWRLAWWLPGKYADDLGNLLCLSALAVIFLLWAAPAIAGITRTRPVASSDAAMRFMMFRKGFLLLLALYAPGLLMACILRLWGHTLPEQAADGVRHDVMPLLSTGVSIGIGVVLWLRFGEPAGKK